MENQEVVEVETVDQKPNRSNSGLIIGLFAVVIVVVGGVALFSRRQQPVAYKPQVIGESEEMPQEINEQTNSIVPSSKVNEIAVEAGSFYYNPSEIRVKLGETVRIILTAKDLMHDFNIDELEIDGPIIKAGESTTIEFMADRVGEFEYYCSVGEHRANGQVGKLIIEEN